MLDDAFKQALDINCETSFVEAATGRYNDQSRKKIETKIKELSDSFQEYDINAMNTRSTNRSGDRSWNGSFDRSSSKNNSFNPSQNSRSNYRSNSYPSNNDNYNRQNYSQDNGRNRKYQQQPRYEQRNQNYANRYDNNQDRNRYDKKFSEFLENPFMQKDDDFLKSPAEAPVHRKVLLEDKYISPKMQKAFDRLCERYDDIISKNSGDIGKTTLVEMEIDTGNHPPIASKPYTLPLKHYDWVQKEIETLERAGIIERSISPCASPTVIVPKKSAPGKHPRRRMCVDYQKIKQITTRSNQGRWWKGMYFTHTTPKNR